MDITDQPLRDKVLEAIGLWNAANTGWQLDPSGTAQNSDVSYVRGHLGKGAGGGVTNADKVNAKGEVLHATVTFDPSLSDGFQWGDGSPGSKTKSILGSILHELSHIIGLTHEGGRRKTTLKIADPSDAEIEDGGATTITEDDKNHAKDAAKPPGGGGPPPKKTSTELGPSSPGTTLGVDGHSVLFPAGVYEDTCSATVFLAPHELLSPDTILYGSGFTIMKGIGILSGSAGRLPGVDSTATLEVTIPYVDHPDTLLDVRDPDYGPFEEASLCPVYFELGAGAWGPVPGTFTVDPANHRITFTWPAPLLVRYQAFTQASPVDSNTGVLQLAIAARYLAHVPKGRENRIQLGPARPNPASGRITVMLALPFSQVVSADVLDIHGRRVAVLASERLFPAGHNPITWGGAGRDGRLAAAGLYVIRVRAEGAQRVSKAVLLH